MLEIISRDKDLWVDLEPNTAVWFQRFGTRQIQSISEKLTVKTHIFMFRNTIMITIHVTVVQTVCLRIKKYFRNMLRVLVSLKMAAPKEEDVCQIFSKFIKLINKPENFLRFKVIDMNNIIEI